MKLNVAVYGQQLGSYRTPNLIKALLDIQNVNVFYLNYEELWQKQTIFSKIFRLLKFHRVLQILNEAIILSKCDVVIIPAMTHRDTYKYTLAKLFKNKIITDFYISFYDSYVNDTKTVSKSSREATVHYNLDRNAITESDTVIFLNEAEAKYYTLLLDVDIKKIDYRIIPLCVDARSDSTNNFANGVSSTFIICWWGTYIPLHGLEKILDAAFILSKQNLDFKIFIFGNSEEKSLPFQNRIRELGLEPYVRIDNTKSFNNGKLEPFLINHCDLGLGSFGDSSKARTVFVNKLADAFALGIPALSIETEAMATLLSPASDLQICRGNAADIAAKITLLATDKPKLLQIGKNGRAIFEKRFSYKPFKRDLEILLSTYSMISESK